MPKFLRENVHCIMDCSLVGKVGFFADNASELKDIVEDNALLHRGYLDDCIGTSTSYPFMRKDTLTRHKFFYYDPYWDLKCAVENGELLEINLGYGWDRLKYPGDFMTNPYNPIPPENYRTVPKDNLKGNSVDRVVTHLELARWLADGHGQAYINTKSVTLTDYPYYLEDEHKPVQDISVRAWGDTEWVEPTARYLGLE